MLISIDRVETIVVRLPPRADFRWLSLSRPLGEFVLARIEANGFEGWGEVVGLRDWGDADGRRHGETPATISAIVHEYLAPALVERPFSLGEVSTRLDEVVVGNPYAKALLDIALHDLVGHAHGVPVHALLGGLAREEVPVAHMLGLAEDDEAVAEGLAAVADGIRALQVKGGRTPSATPVSSAACATRSETTCFLRLDANGGYRGRTRARRAVAALAEAGVDLVEQPLLGLADLGEVTSGSSVPVIADEACWTPSRRARDRGAARSRRAVRLRRQGGRHRSRA